MSKYAFDRITPNDFESMAQALLEKTYRIDGNLIQFGDGADGAREATWTQSNTHQNYCRPSNETTDIPKEWVFQVKYHDIGLRGWSTARDAVVEDLEKELTKIVDKHKVPCHAYVMITNIPFTGVRNRGTRDQISAIAKKWQSRVPEIFVWDAADLSRMLEANESVRTAYIDTILPGDLIKAIYKGITFQEDRRKSALVAYLKFVTEREGTARAEEAGDEPGLSLADVFIDLTMHSAFYEIEKINLVASVDFETDGFDTGDFEAEYPEEKVVVMSSVSNTNVQDILLDDSPVRSSYALLIADDKNKLLLGGPGLGKSTLTQFASLYHAARLVDKPLAQKLAGRLKLHKDSSPAALDGQCRLRFPFRIELRRYARWMGEEQKNGRTGEIARYITEMLINPNVSASLNMDDIFALAASDPILLILDGLDEVPHPEARKQIIANLHVFLRRAGAENGDIQLLFSSRPKGYSGEFIEFEPFTWKLNDLERTDFDNYCDSWLNKRVRDINERREARERINRGMKSESVQRLAQSLLQATVMLTIVRRKSEIPHQRHALYAKYVEVIFDREKEKSQIVRDHEVVLSRLHERVGYELHRMMEQTKVEALDSESFRKYVLNVIEDYSGTDLGQKKIREVADEIITAATDRLCLLVGKGKEQADIDFVVQSYREYFAAVYLFNHPDADPNRVFTMLVRRGPYWANVLQFYVAQANANQQMRWVLNAEDSNFDISSIDSLSELIRTRRALVNVLPEFNLQRNSDFERALKIIFHISTRWTWLKQGSVTNALRFLRSGCAKTILTELLVKSSIGDLGALAAELRLLVGLTSNDSVEFEKFRGCLADLLNEDEIKTVVAAFVIQNGLPINLSKFDISTLFKNKFINKGEMSLAFLEQQNPETQCALLLSGFTAKKQQLKKSVAYQIETSLAPFRTISLFSNNITFELPSYLCRHPQTTSSLSEIRNKYLESKNASAAYIGALASAAIEPTNWELDVRARSMERAIDIHLFKWKSECILGPPEVAFPSREKWKQFSDELVDITFKNPNWLNNIVSETNLDELWPTLLFHPHDWPLLVENGLLTRNNKETFVHSPLGNLLSQTIVPILTFSSWSASSEAKHNVPLGQLLSIALQIAEKEGIERIGKGGALAPMLCYGGTDKITVNEAESLLCRAIALPTLPADWIAAMLRLCLDTKGIDIKLLLNFWKHSKDQKVFLNITGNKLPDEYNKIINELLDMNDPDAFNLAMTIMSSASTRPEILTRYYTKLTRSYPFLHDFENYKCINSILCQVPTFEEFQIWQRWDEATNLVCDESTWIFERIIERFQKIVNAEGLDRQKLRNLFSSFVTKRHNYPEQIPCAALEALLNLDSGHMPPLQDEEWQQGKGSC